MQKISVKNKNSSYSSFCYFSPKISRLLIKKAIQERGDGLTPLGVVTGWAGLPSVAISLSELLFL